VRTMQRNKVIAFISAGVLTVGVGAAATSALAAGSTPAQPTGSGTAAIQPAGAVMQPVVAKQTVKAPAKTPIKHAATSKRAVRHVTKHSVRSRKVVRPATKALNNAPRKAVMTHSAVRKG
jgi:hypothetical protein